MTIIHTSRGELEIRELRSAQEMMAAEELQVQVWGIDTKPHPKEIIIAIQHVGGLAAGSFTAAGELVGFVFGFPTRDPHLMHSHLLATLEAWRGCGIGAQMKWFQRAWCLERDIHRVQWTVDPLRASNAELNIRRLGGVASTYFVDYYGTMSGIDAGAPSDRLLIDWDLRSERVSRRAEATPPDIGFPGAQAAIEGMPDDQIEARLDRSARQVLVRIPETFVGLAKTNPQLAARWRMQTRAAFQAYFARGYQVSEFTRAGGPAYLLTIEEGTAC